MVGILRWLCCCFREPTAACCFPDGHCEELLTFECVQRGGQPLGSGSSCATADCEQQACCFDSGSCQDMPPQACQDAGGEPQGQGTMCATTDCAEPAACCLPSGACILANAGDCAAQGGRYFAGRTCDEVNCECWYEAFCCICRGCVPERVFVPCDLVSGPGWFFFNGACYSVTVGDPVLSLPPGARVFNAAPQPSLAPCSECCPPGRCEDCGTACPQTRTVTAHITGINPRYNGPIQPQCTPLGDRFDVPGIPVCGATRGGEGHLCPAFGNCLVGDATLRCQGGRWILTASWSDGCCCEFLPGQFECNPNAPECPQRCKTYTATWISPIQSCPGGPMEIAAWDANCLSTPPRAYIG